MSEYLEMNSLQIGMVLLVVMIGGMPGSSIGKYFFRRYQNPIWSAQICLVVFTLNTLGAGMFVRASTKNLEYCTDLHYLCGEYVSGLDASSTHDYFCDNHP